MKITEYENLAGEPMILIIDEENDKAESMSKAEYDRRQAQQSTPSLENGTISQDLAQSLKIMLQP